MSWVRDKQSYLAIAREIDPAIILTTKDAWVWKVIAAVVMVFTFGGISYREFLEEYATTIGPVQAYPAKWSRLSRRLLVHEARHTVQCGWCGWAFPILGWVHPKLRPWAGLPFFGVAYLLVFLPLGLAFVRWRAEIDADRASYARMLHDGDSPDRVRMRARAFAAKVCGGNYGWSWPKKWGVAGFVKAADGAIAEYEQARAAA
jgi:hypothetical protein